MSEQATQKYDDSLMTLLEAIWGEGFMSPGGVDGILYQGQLCPTHLRGHKPDPNR